VAGGGNAKVSAIHLYGALSRFIPPEVAALFERVVDPGVPGVGSVAQTVDTLPVAAVGKLRLGGAWD
jgi:hypothetical protein